MHFLSKKEYINSKNSSEMKFFHPVPLEVGIHFGQEKKK